MGAIAHLPTNKSSDPPEVTGTEVTGDGGDGELW